MLDIDGVLNPKLVRGDGDGLDPQLPDVKVALIRRLEAAGRIAWVSSWQADMISKLEGQLHLEEEPLHVTIIFRQCDGQEPTPKLRSVARWLARMEATGDADWDAVVWIDDVLGPDVREWARRHHQPVFLQKPDPESGLSEAHVVAVEVFLNSDQQGQGFQLTT